MSNFDSGVSFYHHGEVTIQINFPEGERKCKWCPFCRMDNGIRYRCQLTNRILYSPETMHDECPIEFKEDANEQPDIV